MAPVNFDLEAAHGIVCLQEIHGWLKGKIEAAERADDEPTMSELVTMFKALRLAMTLFAKQADERKRLEGARADS